MQTNFFSTFETLQLYGSFQLYLTVSAGQIQVCIVPTSDKKEGAPIQPLNFKKCTPAELDAGFFANITKPLQEATGMLANLAAFQQSVAAATAAKTATKTTSTAGSKPTAPTLPKKYTAALESSKQLEVQGKIGQAIAAMPKATEFPAQATEITERLNALRAKHGGYTAVGLFDTPAATTDTTPAATPPDAVSVAATSPDGESTAARTGEEQPEDELEEENDAELTGEGYPKSWDDNDTDTTSDND